MWRSTLYECAVPCMGLPSLLVTLILMYSSCLCSDLAALGLLQSQALRFLNLTNSLDLVSNYRTCCSLFALSICHLPCIAFSTITQRKRFVIALWLFAYTFSFCWVSPSVTSMSRQDSVSIIRRIQQRARVTGKRMKGKRRRSGRVVKGGTSECQITQVWTLVPLSQSTRHACW